MMEHSTTGPTDSGKDRFFVPNGRLRLWLGIGLLFPVVGFLMFKLTEGTAASAEKAAATTRFALVVACLGVVLIVAVATMMPRRYEFAEELRIKYLFRTRSISWDDVASITTEEVDNVATDIDPSRGRLKNQVIAAGIAGVAGASGEELRAVVTLRSGATVKFYVSPEDARRLVRIWQRHCPTGS